MKKQNRKRISIMAPALMTAMLGLSPMATQTVWATEPEVLSAVTQSCFTFNPQTGEMVLRGTVDWQEMYNFVDKTKVTSVVAQTGTVFPVGSCNLFDGYENVQSIDLSNVNTSQAILMDSMFRGCKSLTKLDLRKFNTSNVTSMTEMFNGCTNLTSLNISSFDTKKVENMHSMFKGCTSLTDLDLSSFNTQSATQLSSMFEGCTALQTIKLGNFANPKVDQMNKMFYNCSSLNSINMSNFSAPSATYMDFMFYKCSSLTTLDLSRFNSHKAFSMMDFFNGCSSLTNLDLSGFYTSGVYQMQRMFKDCSSLTTLDVSKMDTSYASYTIEMFAGCSSLTSLDISNFDCSNFYYSPNLFNGCSSLTTLNLGNIDTSNMISMEGFFANCSSLKNIDLSHFNTSKVSTMKGMFSGCSSLKKLDLSTFDTSNVTTMVAMFKDCSSLTSLDLRPLETQKVTDINSMFEGCKKLQSVDLSKFTAPNANSAHRLFKDCSSLQSIDLSAYNPTSLSSVNDMFSGCSSLKNVDLSHLNLTNSTWIDNMFSGCSSLENLDLSNPTLQNVVNMSRTFYGCTNLKNLNLSGVNTSKLKKMDEAFTGCDKLEYLYLGKDFSGIEASAQLSNGKFGWAVGSAGGQLISGTDPYAVFKNKADTEYFKRFLLSGDLTIQDGNGTVVDTPICDMVLTAVVENEDCPANNFSYQWKRDDKKITGATASTYTLSADDVDHRISCVVTDKTGKYHSELTYEIANKILKKEASSEDLPLTVTPPTAKGAADGKISGLTTDMEFALSPDFSDAVKCTTTVIEGLTAGTYYVRLAETPTTYAGTIHTFVMEDGPEPSTNPDVEHAHAGENVIFHEEVPSTCTEVGNAAYYECSCGKFFSDKECTIEIEKDSWFRDKKGHDYGEATYTWSADNKSVTAKKVCKNDSSHEESEQVETTYEVIAPATETDPELRRYTAVFSKEGFETQTKDVEVKEESETPTESDVTIKFVDIAEDAWYVDAIQFVYDLGLMNGVSDDIFSPGTTLTRAQFVTVLHNMEETPDAEYSPIFTDVPNGKWFTKPVMWAYANKITSGVSENEFGTSLEITREQLATLLYKYVNQKDTYTVTSDDSFISTFPDADQITDWAEEGMKWAVSNGIMSGKPGADGKNYLDPKGKATRAECAQMIKNLFDNMIQ